MSYGLKTLFYKNKEDEVPRYDVEINRIVFPYNMIGKYDFKEVFISEGYMDYQLEVSKDELYDVVIRHYGEELTGYICEVNQELLCVVFEGDECERICLNVYEYDNGCPIGIELYSDDNTGAERQIGAYLNGDNLIVEQQDIGELVKEYWGDSDYERILTIPLQEIKGAFDVLTTGELLDMLKSKFNTSDAIDAISQFCTDKDIKYQYYSHV